MYQEELAENNTKKNEQLTLLFAHYGRALYVAQVLEQETINMIAIDEIVSSKPDSESAYDTIWAKYDIGKRMMGVMTNLLQQAYDINDVDMEELKNLLSVKNDLANRYFRFNDLTVASEEVCNHMIKDFVDFTQRVQVINEKLDLYRGFYSNKTGFTAENKAIAMAAKKEEWQHTSQVSADGLITN